jgi:hypothetical protein
MPVSREYFMRVLAGEKGERVRVLLFFILLVLAVGAGVLSRFAWAAFVSRAVVEPAAPALSAVPQVVPSLQRVGASELPVFAVVVENSSDARPQSGVEGAFAVYEVPVEGNITRWLALFDARAQAGAVEEIGPVRSLRPALLELAAPWEPLLAHVGGSPEALENVQRLELVRDADEFFHAGSFWRAKKRNAPHNVYTSTERLARLLATESTPLWRVPRRQFLETVPAVMPAAGPTVQVPYHHATYDVEWRWNGAHYERYQQGTSSRMASGEIIAADTVAIVKTAIAVVDGEGRKRITLTGTGEAKWCTYGTCIDATWKKASASEPLLFLDPVTNERLYEAPGVLWVSVVATK